MVSVAVRRQDELDGSVPIACRVPVTTDTKAVRYKWEGSFHPLLKYTQLRTRVEGLLA
jgi:hypothetical protein